MEKVRPFGIPKMAVWDAYLSVKRAGGGPGVDGETMEVFEEDLKNNLYKIWNRLSSGSYFPPAVLRVEIPKENGGVRKLGIPTIGDRIAQSVIKGFLEPIVEPVFHNNSYGYRPGRSAIMALKKTRERCWRDDWVLDLDLEKFFDTLDHELVLRAVARFTSSKWILLYVERWLKAKIVSKDGEETRPTCGSPQGGVISPLLANIFMHLAFDSWMEKNYPAINFERYADDIVVHCRSHTQLQMIQEEIRKRLEKCKLQLNATKTKIVYCRDSNRGGSWDCTSFDFLGHTFRPRSARNNEGKFFVSFGPAVSQKSQVKFRSNLKGHPGLRQLSAFNIRDLAESLNPIIRGWINYFGHFRKSEMHSVFNYINLRILKWAAKKYKRLGGRINRANGWLKAIAIHNPHLFAHWSHWNWIAK